jgi:hypothetical protein
MNESIAKINELIAIHDNQTSTADLTLARLRNAIFQTRFNSFEDLQECVSFLYWNKVFEQDDLIQLFGLTNQNFISYITPRYTGGKCQLCKRELRFHTIEEEEEYCLSGRIDTLCPLCSIDKNKSNLIETDGVWWSLGFLTEQMISALKTMPYSEYLNTEVWDLTRRRALDYAGHKCQVCNRDDITLNVHHRTYERRGEEYPQDLIVLCEDCHKLFHFKLGEDK